MKILIFWKSKMTSYDFYPFVYPSNTESIAFPDFSTIMERQEVSLPIEEKTTEEPKKEDIDDVGIDFSKMKISRGRQTKSTGGYSHSELKDFGKDLKLRGFDINFKSKESIIDSILLLQ